MPKSFHGTGDIFASVLTGALVQGVPLDKAYAMAGDFVAKSIEFTLKEKNYNTYGVNFEQAIPYLVGRMSQYIY